MINLYTSTKQNGHPNIWRLYPIFDNGSKVLEYQRRQGNYPAFYYSQGNPNQRLFSFSQIRNIVTSLIDPGAEEKLQAWRERVGEVEANLICAESKLAGEMGHKMLENWTHHKPLGICDVKMRGYKQALENHILPYLHRDELGLSVTDKSGSIIPLSEVFVADFEHQFIGRLDLVTRINIEPYNEKLVLLELKGSRKEKNFEFMQPHIIQAVAYQTTFNKIAAVMSKQLVSLDGVVVAYMYSNGYGNFIPILGEDLAEYKQTWQQWLNCFHEEVRGLQTA